LIDADLQIGEELRNILDLVEDDGFIAKCSEEALRIMAGKIPGKGSSRLA